MMIKSKFTRRSMALAVGAALAVGSQFAIAANQQMAGQVNIEPRDISTKLHNILHFGQIKVGPSGGTVTISDDGGQNIGSSGDVVHITGGNEGTIGIQGEKNQPVTITLDTSFVLSPTSVTGAADLTVTTSMQNDTWTLTGENGQWNFMQIGGTLTIPGNQPADTYTGFYNATVNYQ